MTKPYVLQKIEELDNNVTKHLADTATENVHGLSPERVRKITFGTADPDPENMEEGEVYFQYE